MVLYRQPAIQSRQQGSCFPVCEVYEVFPVQIMIQFTKRLVKNGTLRRTRAVSESLLY